jgi:hypothetical protein
MISWSKHFPVEPTVTKKRSRMPSRSALSSVISRVVLRARPIEEFKSAGGTARDHTAVRGRGTRTEDAEMLRVRRTLSAAASVVAILGAGAFAIATSARADEPFGLKSFSNRTTDEAELPYTLAGGHPYENTTAFSTPVRDGDIHESPVEQLRGTYVRPPLGVFGNPAAASRCPAGKIIDPAQNTGTTTDCPPGSRIGFTVTRINDATSVRPLYNLPPARGFPAQFGFKISGALTVISVFLRPRTDSYGLTVGTPNIPSVGTHAFSAVFFGVPGRQPITGPKDGSGGTEAPFVSNPVNCSDAAPRWSIAIDSNQHAGSLLGLGIPDLSDPDWKTATDPAPAVTDCDDPALADQFDPSLSIEPLQSGGPVQADQPTGLSVGLDFPQSNDPTEIPSPDFDPETPQAPEPKDITVKLPASLAISPSSADGLGACSDLPSDPAGDQVHYDNTKPVACPDASKIGSALATSPLLAAHEPTTDDVVGPEPIHGDVYLLKPHAGDLVDGSDGKFRLLIQLESERYGINFKLPGIATANKQTGQITTVFTENPQLPASHLTVNLKPGPRAPLMTPITCGKFDTTSTLVPWSTPGTPDAHPTASFQVGSGPNGSGCPLSPQSRSFAPTIDTAGPDTAKAGATSPFTLKITRADGEQELSSVNVTTPPGFTAKLKGVATCSDAAIAAAATKSGAEEQSSSSCPASSQVGTVIAAAGPGTNPYNTPGKAYLAGPYKGAPLSFAFITPAVAGPFDLGNVVIRAGAYLDPATAAVTVKTDQLPTMLDGVPLRLRSITARLDRADFTLNPTDCEALKVSAAVKSTDGATANPSTLFQVGGCKDLGFKPTLKLSLKGKVSRRAHPSLRAHLTARPGDANIARAQVKLPKAAFLDNAHIGEVCTRVQFAAKACPAGSIYGHASATTPLLGYELTGNVYLRSSSHQLPDLVVGFNGPSSQPIEIELAGKTDSVKGALRNTFEAVPDVPVTDFNLTLFGGKRGLIIMSSGFCKDPHASYKLTGQNGAEYDTTPKVAAKCGKAKKAKGGGKGKGGAHSRLTAFFPGW